MLDSPLSGRYGETSSILTDRLRVCAEVSRGFHHDIKIFNGKNRNQDL